MIDARNDLRSIQPSSLVCVKLMTRHLNCFHFFLRILLHTITKVNIPTKIQQYLLYLMPYALTLR
jgi:hypothetical protein